MRVQQAKEMINDRPVVYDYGQPYEFLSKLLLYYKSNSSFSLRQRTAKVGMCSQALVSQILQGKRNLTRDNLSEIATIFKLTKFEIDYLDKKISAKFHKIETVKDLNMSSEPRLPKNHLLSDWVNPYIKDIVNLKGFQLDSETIFSMLQGFIPLSKIKKSVDFLLKEGFWRKNLAGEVVLDEAAVTTTNGIANEKIRTFHTKALETALIGLKTLPVDKRKASTVLISVDQAKMDELRGIIDLFQKQLLEFIEKNPSGQDSLVQITTHLTPIGRSYEK
ncbi:MAG: DUF4423 domain-containing protein [Bdellovibrionaceae bacterium]|nr:DUF4423 domain-containing protein [Pseudobdellovibrionaceae bacterium]